VEDVVTSGGAVLDAVAELRRRGATVERAVCVIDRESGGPQRLAEHGIELKALFTMTELKAAACRPLSRRRRLRPVAVTAPLPPIRLSVAPSGPHPAARRGARPGLRTAAGPPRRPRLSGPTARSPNPSGSRRPRPSTGRRPCR